MRAFLCLTPDPQSALDIDRWAAQCWPNIDKLVPAQNLHVTLAFLGDIDHQTELHLSELIAESAPAESFSMTFDKVGYWPQPQVLWLGSECPCSQVASLARSCRQVANRLGIRVNGKRFEPHITLARKPLLPPQAPLLIPAFHVRFDAFQLCESFLDKRGARYVVREEWSLV